MRRDVAQPGSAHAWGAWGRRFKSARPDHSAGLLFISKIKGDNYDWIDDIRLLKRPAN